MSNHDLRLLRSNGAEQDQVLGRRKGFGLFFRKFKGSSDPTHFIFEINGGKSRIRHRTALNSNGIIFNWFWIDLEIQFPSRSMADPTLSDNDFKNKLAWVWTTLINTEILTKIISVQNEVTDKLVKFNRLGLSRFDGDQLNFFEGRVWTRKSVQLKSSLDQAEAANQESTDRQPVDQKKSLFSITKSNYRLQSSSDTLTIQLS